MPPNPWDGRGEMEDYLKLTKAQYREAKLAYRQGGNKRWAPIYEDANKVVDAVHDNDAELWVATTRPWMRLDNIDPDTRYWLDAHDIRYDGLIYGEDKYFQLAERVEYERIVLVIDDLKVQLEAAHNLGLDAWQVSRYHNSNHTARWYPRGHLYQAPELIRTKIELWKKSYG